MAKANVQYVVNTVAAASVITQFGMEDCELPAGVGVGNTFVGTVVCEVCYDPASGSPTWIQFGAALTAPGTFKIDIPVKAVRARCSAYTSGSITAGIGVQVAV